MNLVVGFAHQTGVKLAEVGLLHALFAGTAPARKRAGDLATVQSVEVALSLLERRPCLLKFMLGLFPATPGLPLFGLGCTERSLRLFESGAGCAVVRLLPLGRRRLRLRSSRAGGLRRDRPCVSEWSSRG